MRLTWDPHKGRPGFFLSDATRGQRLAAGYDGWFAGVPVHINSLELRDAREYDLAKKPNTFRILVLGDSVTFGHGSVHTYPELLEARLKSVAARGRLAGLERRRARLQHQPGTGAPARGRSGPSSRISSSSGSSRTTSPTISRSERRGASASSRPRRCRSRGAISTRWSSTRRSI